MALNCDHEAFRCSGSGPIIRHSCEDCGYCWTNNTNKRSGFVHCVVCIPPVTFINEINGGKKFTTKDSGVREEYDSGMRRDTQDDKPRFDLLLPLGVPYSDQFLTRVAELLARGAEKYGERNWEKAEGAEELERFQGSGLRHFHQWMAGETDEDHAAAVVFNLLGAETVRWKMERRA